MTLASDLLTFTLAASLLTITPGLDTALVLRTLAANGPAQAFKAACGVALGCLAWGLIVAAGLGALLAASRLAYDALRWVGAVYLFYLGAKLILSPRRQGLAASMANQPAASRAWARGFLTNILNPKVGIFYVSFLPQFIPAHMNVSAMIVALASIHVLLGIAWFGLLIAGARAMLPVLQKPRVVAAMDRLTGCVFIAFGLKLALGDRA
ncbi:LysE family translocator [Acidisoma silvae]|uniref:LysE family translocator n=1 Tax=Acidisoma silvae TaxID=2802396 RepID=A0A963YNY2_9PROT|nr:LysE family translocator [Acidisoma silvae]MCB8874056.1 LysE family translocator [Acidisoma silvae]